jgi:hypothetical protein
MENIQSGNTPCAQGNLGARFPAMDQATPTVNAALGTVNAADPNDVNDPNNTNDPNNATLNGTMMAGTTTMATPKIHTLVIAKIVLLCCFPKDSTMVR